MTLCLCVCVSKRDENNEWIKASIYEDFTHLICGDQYWYHGGHLIQQWGSGGSLFPWIQERGGAAGRGRLSAINSALEITWFCSLHINTGICAYCSKFSLTFFVYLFFMCDTAFPPWYICFPFFVCHELQASSNPPPLAHGVSSRMLCSHIGFCLLHTRAPGREYPQKMMKDLTGTFAFTHTPPPEKLKRISRVKCMSTSILIGHWTLCKCME